LRKKKSKRESSSVQIISKARRKYEVLKTIGVDIRAGGCAEPQQKAKEEVRIQKNNHLLLEAVIQSQKSESPVAFAT